MALVMLLPAWSQVNRPISVVGAMVLNYVPGFGLGSFIQDDACGGSVEIIYERIGVAFMISMVVIGSRQPDEVKVQYMTLALAVGSLPVVALLVYGLVRPVWYATMHQRRHQEEEITIRVSPSITSSAGKNGFNSGVELAFHCPRG